MQKQLILGFIINIPQGSHLVWVADACMVSGSRTALTPPEEGVCKTVGSH